MATFDEVMQVAAPPEDVVRLCLAGDLQPELHQLEEDLATAPKAAASLADRSPASLLVEAIDAVRERMRAATVAFRLRRISPKEWPAFWEAKPVRAKDETDEAFGVRWYEWVAELVSRSCVDPVMTVEQVGELVDRLNTGGWEELSDRAYRLNVRKVDIPFSPAVSAPTPSSAPT